MEGRRLHRRASDEMALIVGSNIPAFTRRLARIRRDQVPFATAQALTATAFDIRTRIVTRTYPSAFTVRNAGFPRTAFRVIKARKRKPIATVFDRLGRSFLELQARGGTKRSRGGHRLAIPSRRIRRTGRGRIRTSQLPRNIVQRRRVYVGEVSRAFEGIWRQTRGGLELLYSLLPSARIPKRFMFYEDAERQARTSFRRQFSKALVKAIRTAR